MSAGVESTDADAVVNDLDGTVAPAPVSVGECLRLAREARGDSLADAAQALRIGVRQVEAIEHDDWAALPGTPFVRGFVRNYARWLGQDGDALVAQIEVAALPDSPVLDLRASTTASLPQGHSLPRRDFATLGLAVAVVVLAVLAYAFVPDDFWALPEGISRPEATSTTAPQTTSVAVAAPAGTGPVAADTPNASDAAPVNPGEASPVAAAGTSAVTPTAASVESGAAATPVAAPLVAPAPANAATPPSPPATTPAPSLELRFDGRAWAEIRDHQGVLIFSDTLDGGATRAIAGKGPFLVVIGKADVVRLRYKGKTVDLAPHTRRNVARLTLE